MKNDFDACEFDQFDFLGVVLVGIFISIINVAALNERHAFHSKACFQYVKYTMKAIGAAPLAAHVCLYVCVYNEWLIEDCVYECACAYMSACMNVVRTIEMTLLLYVSCYFIPKL